MAAPTRTIRIKFDGSAQGLRRAADAAAKSIDKFGQDVDRKSGRIGAKLGVKFGDGILSVMGKLPISPQLAAVAAGMAVAMAPILGAGLAAAVIGAVGAGGIVGGIAGAARSPLVKAEFGFLASEAEAALADIGVPFIEPLRKSLAILRHNLHDLRPDLVAAFAPLAGVVEPLTRGLVGMVRSALPGLRRLFEASAPVLRSLAKDLPKLGAAMSAFFDSIARSGPGAEKFFRMLINLTATHVVVLGNAVELLTKAFDLSTRWGGLIGMQAESPKKQIKGLQDASKEALGSIRFEATSAAEAVQILNDRFDKLFGRQMNLQEATDRWTLGMLKLKGALQENGHTLDANTEKGIANRDLIRDQIDAAKGMRDAAIEQGDGTKEATDKANAAYESQLNAIRKLGIQAGLSAAQLDALLAPFRNPPPPMRLRVQIVTEGQIPGARGGPIIGFAKGGITKAARGLITKSPTVLFGERGTGREGFVPQRGITRQRRLGLTSEIASWSNATVVPNEQMGRGPDHLTVVADFGHGFTQRIQYDLREHDRGLRRRAMAGSGAR